MHTGSERLTVEVKLILNGTMLRLRRWCLGCWWGIFGSLRTLSGTFDSLDKLVCLRRTGQLISDRVDSK